MEKLRSSRGLCVGMAVSVGVSRRIGLDQVPGTQGCPALFSANPSQTGVWYNRVAGELIAGLFCTVDAACLFRTTWKAWLLFLVPRYHSLFLCFVIFYYRL
jgi:hypothetical protein